MATRRLALALVAAGVLVLPAGLATAQEPPPPPSQDLPEEATGSWAGTRVSNTAHDHSTGTGATVDGTIQFTHWSRPLRDRDSAFVVRLELPADGSQPAAPGCAEPTIPLERQARATRTDSTFRGSFSDLLSAPCNGRYQVIATIQPAWWSDGARTVLATTAVVARPAGAPVDVAASRGKDGSVSVTWKPPGEGVGADFAGYRVVCLDGGEPVATTDLGADATSYRDDSSRAAPGTEVTYQVRSLRHGPDAAVASAPGAASVTVPAASGGAGGGSGGDDGGDGSDGSPTEPGGSPSVTSRAPGHSVPRANRPSVGRRGPSRPAIPRTSTTIDTGYDEVLPWGDREEGDLDPVLPDDEFASLIYDDGDDQPGAGLLIPVATGSVLAAWALHLRYLSRLARPQ